MMKFPLHSVDTAPAGAQETLAAIAKQYGFVPNLAAVFAESPGTLNGLLGLLHAYDAPEMTLPALERQIVLLTVSVHNKCEYCTAAHSMLASMNNLDRAEIERLQQGQALQNARLESLRRFTEAVVSKQGHVSSQEMEAFTAADFSREQILEVMLGVALKTLTNYVNHIAKPPVNEQFKAFLPQWASAQAPTKDYEFASSDLGLSKYSASPCVSNP